MENQHRQIKGYRELSQAEIDLMNEVKALGPQLEALCNKVKAHIDEQKLKADSNEDEMVRLSAANPEHWESWGRSSFQASLMYLTRAIAQPTFF
jgi:hypothetical protein